MRGGSQSILVRASDGHSYVVKSISNPQGRRSVINDLVASVLAAEIGLPVAVTGIVEATEQFIAKNHLKHNGGGNTWDWPVGLQLGSQTPADPDKHAMYDYIPLSTLGTAANIDAALGCWLFDAWTGNGDSAQAVFYKKERGRRGEKPYAFIKIDHGFCFGYRDWLCHDLRREPVFFQEAAMPLCAGLGDFEPYLSRIGGLSLEHILESASSVPGTWWENEKEFGQFLKMLTHLHQRASQLESIVHSCWPTGVAPLLARVFGSEKKLSARTTKQRQG